MNENVKDLIDAIQSGKASAIEASFERVMSDKVYSAIEAKRSEISYNLLGAHNSQVVEDEEPPMLDPDDEDEDSHGL